MRKVVVFKIVPAKPIDPEVLRRRPQTKHLKREFSYIPMGKAIEEKDLAAFKKTLPVGKYQYRYFEHYKTSRGGSFEIVPSSWQAYHGYIDG